MARLSEAQKAAVVANAATFGEDVKLVRVRGQWATLWYAKGLRPADRWRGQLLGRVISTVDVDSMSEVWEVHKLGSECTGRTRRRVIEALESEAS
jgi:hypothetical protein